MSARSKMLGLGRRVDRVAVPIAFWRTGYRCPLCGYEGHFLNDWVMTGIRPNATCPSCGGHERHRIQWAVMDQLASMFDFGSMAMLHLAPESHLARRFRAEFGQYTTAEFDGRDADLRVDLTDTDLPDESYDVVYASHVLEHIPDDLAAARTVRRLLRPGGFAVLPVPIVCEKTVEYPQPVATEFGHVRGPGPDYFDRFGDLFDIELYTSADVDQSIQPWVYEHRSSYPTASAPYRTPSVGRRHTDIVPVMRRPA